MASRDENMDQLQHIMKRAEKLKKHHPVDGEGLNAVIDLVVHLTHAMLSSQKDMEMKFEASINQLKEEIQHLKSSRSSTNLQKNLRSSKTANVPSQSTPITSDSGNLASSSAEKSVKDLSSRKKKQCATNSSTPPGHSICSSVESWFEESSDRNGTSRRSKRIHASSEKTPTTLPSKKQRTDNVKAFKSITNIASVENAVKEIKTKRSIQQTKKDNDKIQTPTLQTVKRNLSQFLKTPDMSTSIFGDSSNQTPKGPYSVGRKRAQPDKKDNKKQRAGTRSLSCGHMDPVVILEDISVPGNMVDIYRKEDGPRRSSLRGKSGRPPIKLSLSRSTTVSYKTVENSWSTTTNQTADTNDETSESNRNGGKRSNRRESKGKKSQIKSTGKHQKKNINDGLSEDGDHSKSYQENIHTHRNDDTDSITSVHSDYSTLNQAWNVNGDTSNQGNTQPLKTVQVLTDEGRPVGTIELFRTFSYEGKEKSTLTVQEGPASQEVSIVTEKHVLSRSKKTQKISRTLPQGFDKMKNKEISKSPSLRNVFDLFYDADSTTKAISWTGDKSKPCEVSVATIKGGFGVYKQIKKLLEPGTVEIQTNIPRMPDSVIDLCQTFGVEVIRVDCDPATVIFAKTETSRLPTIKELERLLKLF